jgi:hypothetical protein
MAVYGIERLTTNIGSPLASYELRTASTDRAKVERIGIFVRAAASALYGIGRPAAIGVTPTSPATWLALDPAEPAGTVQTALAWGTGPTSPVNFFRRFTLAVNSEGIIFTFPSLLTIAISSSIVLWNIQSTVAVHVVVQGEE